MPRKTKRQLQISKIPRKKGRYISKDEIEAVEGEKWMDNENIDEWTEGGIVEDQIEDEINNDWTKEDLKEFEKVGKKLITKVLCWHEKAAGSIRAAYNGTSRTTIW